MTTPTIDRPSTGTGLEASALTSAPAMPSDELLYEARLQITGMTEYGVTLAELTARTAPIPPEGVRLDVAFEGAVYGPMLDGTGAGVDYALIRADGGIQLHIHARITTVDGASISMVGDGSGSVDANGLVQIRETVRLHSSHPDYRWVNTLGPWGAGTVDFAKREIHARSFVAQRSGPKPNNG